MARSTDLATASPTGLQGEPVVEVARQTLETGRSFIQVWDGLKPILVKLTQVVGDYVDRADLDPEEAASLLSKTATVVQKVGVASTSMLRSSEGLSKLALLMAGGTKRAEPRELTEKQMRAVVLETAKTIVQELGMCPFCARNETAVSESCPSLPAS